MKLLLSIFFIIVTLNSFSQSNETKAYNKVKSIYKTKCLPCIAGSEVCSIYFNKSEKGIDIYDRLIPLNKVKITYLNSSLSPKAKHFVKFDCIDGNCIFNSKDNQEISSFSIPFASKQNCYEFIEAIAELKETF